MKVKRKAIIVSKYVRMAPPKKVGAAKFANCRLTTERISARLDRVSRDTKLPKNMLIELGIQMVIAAHKAGLLEVGE